MTPKQQPKARTVWAHPLQFRIGGCQTTVYFTEGEHCHRYAILDTSDEAALVEAGAKAIYDNVRRNETQHLTWETTFEIVRSAYLIDSRTLLTALGILPKATKRKANSNLSKANKEKSQ